MGAYAAVGGLRWLGLCGGWGVYGGWACTVVGVPRVWSPFQGCAPWALKRIAPIGACVAVGGCAAVGLAHRLVFPGFGRPFRATHPGLWGGSPRWGSRGCRGWCGGWVSQGLVALSGLRTLGFGKGRPYRGLRGRWGLCGGWCSQGLVALSGLRTLGFGEGRPYRGLRGRWGWCGGWGCAVVGVPRVWSPFQGCAPWALGRVAPIGACAVVGGGVVVGGVRWLVFPGFGRPFRAAHPGLWEGSSL